MASVRRHRLRKKYFSNIHKLWEVEAKLIDMEAKYAVLLQGKSPNDASPSVSAAVAKAPTEWQFSRRAGAEANRAAKC